MRVIRGVRIIVLRIIQCALITAQVAIRAAGENCVFATRTDGDDE